MNRPEQTIHKAIVAYLKLALPKPWMFWHTPNGGYRGRIEGAIFRALGVRAGIPDLFLAGEGRVLWIEVKAARGALTQIQKDTIGALAEAGIPTVVVRSLPEAIAAIEAMGVKLKGRVM